MKLVKQEVGVQSIFKRIDTLVAKINAKRDKDNQLNRDGGEAMKLSVGQWWLDATGTTDPKERDEALSHFMDTPAWFGCNASQGKQARERKEESVKGMTSYGV